MRRLLILGGTGEARVLAESLAGRPGLDIVTSLAGRTRDPARVPGRVRHGGFGASEGLARYLEQEAIDAVVDATHPFAAAISAHAAEACARAGVPRLVLVRSSWAEQPGDRWQRVASLAEAARALKKGPGRVFLSTGRQGIEAFADLERTWFLVRLVEAPRAPLPLARHRLVVDRGPFAEAREIALLARHRIECVVAKRSGGEATYAKIAAARALALPVVLVEPPPPPPGDAAASVAEARAWLERRLTSAVSPDRGGAQPAP